MINPYIITALAYIAIPAALLQINYRLPRAIPRIASAVMWLFILFIVACAVDHAIADHAPTGVRVVTAWIEAVVSVITAVVLWSNVSAIVTIVPDLVELDFWKRVTNVARVGHFKWLRTSNTWMDNTARRLAGLHEAPLEWPPPGETVLYQDWADTVLDAEELESIQSRAMTSTVSGQVYTGLTRHKNGRVLLHKGAPDVDGYLLSGVTLDITGLYEQIVGDTEGARGIVARQHRKEMDRLRDILSDLGAERVDEIRGGVVDAATLEKIKEAVIILQTRVDLIDRDVRENRITAQEVRERQAALRNEIYRIRTMIEGESSGLTGFLERFMATMLGAKKGHILFIAGVILVAVLLIFKAESIASAIVQVLTASAP